MKKLLITLFVAAIGVGGYYALRLLPLVTTDNKGGEIVVLLHGLGRNEVAMLLLDSALTEAGFDVYNIGYPSNQQGPDALLDIIAEKIDSCCAKRPQTVHFVGHSLGGLLIRAYLGRDRPHNLGRVVLLGTPNKGSELADDEGNKVLSDLLLELAGPTAKTLRTGSSGFAAGLPAPDYAVGVIAGTRDNPVSNEWLPLPNDGMVSVESAKLDGMKDFITFDVTHWGLRNEPAVAAQVAEFLLHEQFGRGTDP